MSTKHEFCAWQDTVAHHEPPYHEQLAVMQEFEATRENALKTKGAREALAELKLYLLICGNDDRCEREFWGLKWAIDSINRRLSDLAVEGGGTL